MKTLIEDYRNVPGKHCGSTAMKNLLSYYCNLELSEAEVFGLGSGPDFIYISVEASEPPILTLGRNMAMETDVCQALGIDYRETIDLDSEHAWSSVRQEILEGRPTMLMGDSYYLDYRGFGSHHFAGHRFVLVGFNDETEQAYVADRIEETIESCSYKALSASRNPPLPTSSYNLWGKFHGTRVNKSIEEALLTALAKASQRMLGNDNFTQCYMKMATASHDAQIATGVQGLELFYQEFMGWREIHNRTQILGYSSNCIERFGNGGGNFRRLYAEFLQSSKSLLPDIIDDDMIQQSLNSAEAWTNLSQSLHQLSQNETDSQWTACHAQIKTVLDTEQTLFENIDSKLSNAN